MGVRPGLFFISSGLVRTVATTCHWFCAVVVQGKLLQPSEGAEGALSTAARTSGDLRNERSDSQEPQPRWADRICPIQGCRFTHGTERRVRARLRTVFEDRLIGAERTSRSGHAVPFASHHACVCGLQARRDSRDDDAGRRWCAGFADGVDLRRRGGRSAGAGAAAERSLVPGRPPV